MNIGYPALEDFCRKGGEAVRKDKEYYKILWTPRWTEDKELGGSSFMKYKEQVLRIPDLKEQFYLIFRPHPMTFSHLAAVNRMTEEEADAYLEKFEAHDRLECDTGKDYAEVFWNTDVLLTDISSIIVEYFITGKPIVYCETGAKPDRFFREMMKAFYVVNSWKEAQDRLIKLSEGDDPLREAREKKIKELFGTDFEHISERFLEEIYRDYNS